MNVEMYHKFEKKYPPIWRRLRRVSGAELLFTAWGLRTSWDFWACEIVMAMLWFRERRVAGPGAGLGRTAMDVEKQGALPRVDARAGLPVTWTWALC